jgi:hypothetical protein
MNKVVSAAIILLLAVIAGGTWGIYSVESERKNTEIRQLEAQRLAVLETETYGAWRYATRYETFMAPLADSRQEPKRSDTLVDRVYWVKSFQHIDAKPIGKSPKYGNAAYSVTSIIAFNDRLSSSTFEALLNSKAPIGVLFEARRGEWHVLSVECRAERLDSGEWVAGDYKFSPISTKPDFPFEKVKGD